MHRSRSLSGQCRQEVVGFASSNLRQQKGCKMGKGCIHCCVDNGEEGCALKLQIKLIDQPNVKYGIRGSHVLERRFQRLRC